MIKSSVNIGTVKKAIEKCLNEDVAVRSSISTKNISKRLSNF